MKTNTPDQPPRQGRHRCSACLQDRRMTSSPNNQAKDDGNGGTKLDNNREYGITFEKNVDSPTLYTKESPVGDPTTDATISLSMGNNPEVTYVHSHPSGTKNGYEWQQAPSLPDVQNAGQATQYVIGCRDKTIYMYNNQGILATLPLNIFINYQVKR